MFPGGLFVDLVLDANVVIDLIELGCLEPVLRMQSFRFWITENVRAEIKYSRQREVLERLISQGRLEEAKVQDLDELQLYGDLKKVLADGEAGSLAVASRRAWGFRRPSTGLAGPSTRRPSTWTR